MKIKRNKVIVTRTIFIFVGVSSLFLFVMNFIPSLVVDDGLSTNFTDIIYTDSSKKAYVNSSNPDMNYAQSLYIGEPCEAYVNFSLNSLPNRRTELYFFLRDYRLSHPYIDDLEINIILIKSKWNSSEITWNNKPEHEEIIDVVNISTILQRGFIDRYNIEKAVNLTKLYNYNYPNEISLCVNITLKNELFIFLNQSLSFSPELLWSYEELLLSYTTIITTPILFVILIGVIYFLRKTSIEENKKHNYRLGFSIFWIFTLITVAPLVTAVLMIITNIFDIGVTLMRFVITFILINWFALCVSQIKKNLSKFKEIRKKR